MRATGRRRAEIRRTEQRGRAGYTGCQRRGNRLSIRRRIPGPFPFRVWSFGAMDSFELNKIMGAVLGTCMAILALNIAANAIFHPEKPAKPGYEIALPEKPEAGAPKGPAPQEPPIEQLLAKADVGRGQASANKCVACHTFDKGGRTLQGPNLYGLVGREKGSVQGFNYSPAFRKTMKGPWTPQDISEFVKNPKTMVPGTNMTFAGIPRATERADLIAFLNSKSDNPLPLSKAAEAK
jgi:cytochrome c